MAGDASTSINHQGTSDTDTGGPVMGATQGRDCAPPAPTAGRAQSPQPRGKNERQKYSSDYIFTSNG